MKIECEERRRLTNLKLSDFATFLLFSAAVKSLRVNDCRNGEKQNVAMLQLIQKLKRKDEKDEKMQERRK